MRITLASVQPAPYSDFPPPRLRVAQVPLKSNSVSGWVRGGNSKMSLTFTTRCLYNLDIKAAKGSYT